MCEKCPQQYQYDNNLGKCTLIVCKGNQYFDANAGKCVDCTEQNSYYNQTTDKCEKCPQNYIYNLQTYKCQACPSKTAYNPQTNKC